MKSLLTLILLVTLLASCSTTKKANNMEDPKNQTNYATPSVDTTPKVTGIGGIFFYSDNPKEAKEWYTKNLGIKMNDWGSSGFESRNLNRPEEINSLHGNRLKKEMNILHHPRKIS